MARWEHGRHWQVQRESQAQGRLVQFVKPVTEKSPQAYSQIELVCPRCGERGMYATGKTKCPTCSLGFWVEIGDEVR